MFFGDSFRRNSNPKFTLTLNGDLIDFVDNYEYLGVKLDPRLHFDKHMSKVKRRSHSPSSFSEVWGVQKSVAYYGPTLWNALPHHIRMARDKKHVTRLLKTKIHVPGHSNAGN